MARIDNLSNFLTDVAGAIKNKTGNTNLLYPSNFDTEIANIAAGHSFPAIILNASGTNLQQIYDFGAYFNELGDLVIYAMTSSTSYENIKFTAGTQFIGSKWMGWDQSTFYNAGPAYEPYNCYVRGLSDKKCLAITLVADVVDDTNDYVTITVSIEELNQDPGTRALIYTHFNTGNLTVKLSNEETTRTMAPWTVLQVPIGTTVTVMSSGLSSTYINGIHTFQYCWLKPDSLVRTQITEGSDFLGNSTWQFVMPDTDVSVHAWTMACFVAGTPILMADGTVTNIENIQKDDQVVCYNFNTKQSECQQVTDTFINEKNAFVTLTFDTNEQITCTDGHHIYSITANRFIPAKELNVGDKLQTYNGTCTITNIEYFNKPTTVYNFTVNNQHNYYVGQTQVLVHNIVSG